MPPIPIFMNQYNNNTITYVYFPVTRPIRNDGGSSKIVMTSYVYKNVIEDVTIIGFCQQVIEVHTLLNNCSTFRDSCQ